MNSIFSIFRSRDIVPPSTSVNESLMSYVDYRLVIIGLSLSLFVLLQLGLAYMMLRYGPMLQNIEDRHNSAILMEKSAKETLEEMRQLREFNKGVEGVIVGKINEVKELDERMRIYNDNLSGILVNSKDIQTLNAFISRPENVDSMRRFVNIPLRLTQEEIESTLSKSRSLERDVNTLAARVSGVKKAGMSEELMVSMLFGIRSYFAYCLDKLGRYIDEFHEDVSNHDDVFYRKLLERYYLCSYAISRYGVEVNLEVMTNLITEFEKDLGCLGVELPNHTSIRESVEREFDSMISKFNK